MLPLAMAMVAGAVVLGRDAAGISIRAEAVLSVFLILALLLRLAQVGGAQGDFTKLACVWEFRGDESESRKSLYVPKSQRPPPRCDSHHPGTVLSPVSDDLGILSFCALFLPVLWVLPKLRAASEQLRAASLLPLCVPPSPLQHTA